MPIAGANSVLTHSAGPSHEGLPANLERLFASSFTVTALIQLKELGGPCYRPSGKYSVNGASSSRLNPKCK